MTFSPTDLPLFAEPSRRYVMPPAAPRSASSEAAAVRVTPYARTMRSRVFAHVAACGQTGATRQEIEDLPDGRLATTAAGAERANIDDPPSLTELHASWMARLSGTQGRVLQVLIDAHPDAVSRNMIAEALGIQADTGSFSNNLSKLRTLGLLEDRSRTDVAATSLVFPEGLGRSA